jgi:hypothetical protein
MVESFIERISVMGLARHIATYTSLHIQVNASEEPPLSGDERISSEIFNKFQIIQLVKKIKKKSEE